MDPVSAPFTKTDRQTEVRGAICQLIVGLVSGKDNRRGWGREVGETDEKGREVEGGRGRESEYREARGRAGASGREEWRERR